MRIDLGVISAILRRYKEHATFWRTNTNVLRREIEMFSNVLARVGLYYPPEQLIQIFNSI